MDDHHGSSRRKKEHVVYTLQSAAGMWELDGDEVGEGEGGGLSERWCCGLDAEHHGLRTGSCGPEVQEWHRLKEGEDGYGFGFEMSPVGFSA